MSGLNSLPQRVLVVPIDGTATNPPIQIGGGLTGSSGTGIYGTEVELDISVGGSRIVSITPAGLSATIVGQSISVLTSASSIGGTPTEALVVTGLLTTDTILSVSQSVPGANSLPLLGFNTQTTNHLTAVFSADPGAGAIIKVAIKR